MPLLQVPNELLLAVVETHLPCTHDVGALIKANRQLSMLLTPVLNNMAVRREHLTGALCCAAAAGNADMVRMLVVKGGGWVQVMESAGNRGEVGGGVEDVVRFVLGEGAGLVVRDGGGVGESGLRRMVKGGRGGIVKVLLETTGVRMEWRNAGGRTALHEAAWLGDTRMLRLLLEHGAEVNAKDSIDRTPLHFAVLNECDAAAVLLNAGAEVNCADIYGRTPLHSAARSQGEDMVRFLLLWGGDVTLETMRGQTALHFAAARASEEVVALLLGRS